MSFPPPAGSNFLEEQNSGNYGPPIEEDWNGNGSRKGGSLAQGASTSSQATAFSGGHTAMGGYGGYPGAHPQSGYGGGFPASKPPTFPPPQPPAGVGSSSAFQ